MYIQYTQRLTSYTTANEDFSSDPSQVRGGPTPTLQKAQSISTILSLILSPFAIILVSLWVHELGGVSWSDGKSKTNFNWHPVMMISAYSLMNVGSLIFRVTNTSSYQASIQPAGSTTVVTSPNPKKRGYAKATHAGIWSSSFVLGIIGIIAVFKSHNDELSGYIANLYSLHSWVGVFVLALYTIQFLYGLVVYGFGIGRNGRLGSSTMMTLHKYSGAWINLLVMTTILLGIQENPSLYCIIL